MTRTMACLLAGLLVLAAGCSHPWRDLPKPGEFKEGFWGSPPGPTVVLDRVREEQIRLHDGMVSFTIRGKVRDAIANWYPPRPVSRGGTDINAVQVYLDDKPYGEPVPVRSHREGLPFLRRRRRYEGTFGPVLIRFPLSESEHTVRVETTKNAAGETDDDRVTISLDKHEVPWTGTLDGEERGPRAFLHLYLSQTADSLRFYRGWGRSYPFDHAPVLARQATTSPGHSPTYAGMVNGLPTRITLEGFRGLTDKKDTLKARIAYTFRGVDTEQTIAFPETTPRSRKFLYQCGDPSPEKLKANVYIPVDPKGRRVDQIQFYFGFRPPLPDDPILSEPHDARASLAFQYYEDGAPAVPEEAEEARELYPEIEVSPDITVTITAVGTADPKHPGSFRWTKPRRGRPAFHPDRLDAIRTSVVTYEFGYARLEAVLVETAPNSRLFRGELSVLEPEPQETYVQNLFFEEGPSPHRIDRVRLYTGARPPASDDLTLTEDRKDSLNFVATEEDVKCFVHISDFEELTEDVDTLTAIVGYEHRWSLWRGMRLVETGPTTRLFRSVQAVYAGRPTGPRMWSIWVEHDEWADVGDSYVDGEEWQWHPPSADNDDEELLEGLLEEFLDSQPQDN